MMEYNLDWLREKGFFEKTVPLALAGKDVSVDEKNSLAYVEVKNNEEIEEIKRGLSSHKVRYIWFYFPSESKLKTFRKIGEVKWFFYSPRMRGEYRKSRIDKLNKFSSGDMNILFDIRDVVNRFYWQLWEARIRMARSVKQLKEEKNKLLAVQHLIDRLIFFYFLSQLGLVSISTGNERKVWKLDRTHTREFFKWVCGFLDDEGLQEFLNRIFFDVLGKSEGEGWSGLGFNIEGERFSVVAPSLNGGLFREEKIGGIEERAVKIEGTKELILDILNKYNWIIGDALPEEEDVIGDLTPEIIGHIYEKFVVSLEQIGLEKIDFDDIQTVKGELKLGRKKIGAYYTPEEITNYISKKTIDPCITDRINERFKRRYRNIWNELLYKEKVTKERLTGEEVEIVKFLYFEVLTKLRICDNACGSGSFLIAAGEVLLRFYSRVIRLLRDYQSDDGEVKEVLEDIKRSPSRNYYIVRQIITNNLYGVDIMEGAVEIAKLRFWLWLISQVKPKEAEGRGIETLPNLDYNLMVGNSLIGFIDIEDIEFEFVEKQKRLSSWLGESKEEWLKNLAKEKQKFKTLSALDAERLKEKLDEEIRKARVFLHRKFFEMVKAKGIEMPYEDYEDFAEDLKPFHWGFEFYEVFDPAKPKEERGLDVIIGNPPYVSYYASKTGRQDINLGFKKYLIHEYEFIEDKNNLKQRLGTVMFFSEQAIHLTKNRGFISLIVDTNIHVEAYTKVRKYLVTNISLLKIVEDIKAFEGVGSGQVILVYQKALPKNNFVTFYDHVFNELSKIPQSEISHENNFQFENVNPMVRLINKNSIALGKIAKVQVGYNIGGHKDFLTNKRLNNSFPYVSGSAIQKYFLTYPSEKQIKSGSLYIIYDPQLVKFVTKRAKEQNKGLPGFGDKELYFKEKKLFLRQSGNKIIGTFDDKQYHATHSLFIINKIEKIDINYNLKYLLILLNSSLMTYYAKQRKLLFSEKGKIPQITTVNAEKLPFIYSNNELPFIHLCDCMLFLNETEERRKTEKELIEFIDKQVIDSLVYELYLREKFEEEGLKTNLLGLVESYLKDIEGFESDKEKLKVIKGVVEKIKVDNKVKWEIEKIKSYEWVKVIEGGVGK